MGCLQSNDRVPLNAKSCSPPEDDAVISTFVESPRVDSIHSGRCRVSVNSVLGMPSGRRSCSHEVSACISTSITLISEAKSSSVTFDRSMLAISPPVFSRMRSTTDATLIEVDWELVVSITGQSPLIAFSPSMQYRTWNDSSQVSPGECWKSSPPSSSASENCGVSNQISAPRASEKAEDMPSIGIP